MHPVFNVYMYTGIAYLKAAMRTAVRTALSEVEEAMPTKRRFEVCSEWR
jgi:hypothetical protein